MTDKSVLLPCPFCGEAGETKFFNFQQTHYAQCSNWKCGSKTHSESKQSVIDAWNRRAATSKLSAEQPVIWDEMVEDVRLAIMDMLEPAKGK